MILSDNNVTTVGMMLTHTEDEYVKLGLDLPLVCTMLQKANEIVNPSPQSKGEMVLVL